MTKIILVIAFTLGALQAEGVVHYGTEETKNPQISKPNHPNNNIYTK